MPHRNPFIYEKCSFHPTRILKLLTVSTPSGWSEYGVWHLAENPRSLLFTQAVRDLFLSNEEDLEFIEIPLIKTITASSLPQVELSVRWDELKDHSSFLVLL